MAGCEACAVAIRSTGWRSLYKKLVNYQLVYKKLVNYQLAGNYPQRIKTPTSKHQTSRRVRKGGAMTGTDWGGMFKTIRRSTEMPPGVCVRGGGWAVY